MDVWDALRQDHSCRTGWPVERIKEHLCENAGTHFDLRVVPAFLRILECDHEPDLAAFGKGR